MEAEGVNPFDFDAADVPECLVADIRHDDPFRGRSYFSSPPERCVWDYLSESA
jgi:hypothetical protein